MQLIEIVVTHREGSATVDIRGTLTPHSEDHLVTARSRVSAKNAFRYELGDQELWELVMALRNEVEGWQARLALGYDG